MEQIIIVAIVVCVVATLAHMILSIMKPEREIVSKTELHEVLKIFKMHQKNLMTEEFLKYVKEKCLEVISKGSMGEESLMTLIKLKVQQNSESFNTTLENKGIQIEYVVAGRILACVVTLPSDYKFPCICINANNYMKDAEINHSSS